MSAVKGSGAIPAFAYADLSDEHRCMAIAATADSIAAADEKALFAILSNCTDFDESVQTFAKDVKKHLRKVHGVEDAIATEDLNGDTCLHYAARSGHAIVLRFLHHCGLLKHIDEYVNREGDTPLHEAVSKRRVMFVKQLIFLGANPKAANRQGRTPYSIARKLNDPDLLAALVPLPLAAC